MTLETADDARRVNRLSRAEYDRLLTYLERLEPVGWTEQSACTDLTIRSNQNRLTSWRWMSDRAGPTTASRLAHDVPLTCQALPPSRPDTEAPMARRRLTAGPGCPVLRLHAARRHALTSTGRSTAEGPAERQQARSNPH